MTVKIDADFYNRHANVIINVSTKEKLERVVNFLINCPDPLSFSDPGIHSHFFIVTTKFTTEGNYQVHVSRGAMNCIGWWMKNRQRLEEEKEERVSDSIEG
jgi:hypothetical protein